MSPHIGAMTRAGWLALAVLLAGCASAPPSTGRYESFRAASESVLNSTSQTYIRIEKRQRDFAVLTAPDGQLTATTFQPTIRGKSFDISEQLQSREAALEVLASYAQALEALAAKDFSTDLDKSVQDLGASVRLLSGLGGTTSANVFTAVLQEFARAGTGRMRKDALRSAMIAGQPGVDGLARLLAQDHERISTFVMLMRDRYIAHAQVARPNYGTWQRYRFDQEVAATLEEFEQIDQALKSASVAVQKIPDAHRQILDSLDEKERPLDALRDVVAEARRLRSFYRSLPTN